MLIFVLSGVFFFQAEDGIRGLVRSRGLGDVYKRQLRSGLLVSLVDVRGVRYYGSHLSKVQVSVGQRVSRGQRVGSVGDTGNAKGGPAHLHFETKPTGGKPMNPYPAVLAACKR